jgi:prepilin-type N-terminal cleavage/methylation domain-containing protein
MDSRVRHENDTKEDDSLQGFTLIELSIVLVIIGFIVGGVLVGQDMIRASEVRATISQIEKYNTAVNTFRGKFNALPGDMTAATATQFGFASRGASAGEGDGNGIIEGVTASSPGHNWGYVIGSGETGMFWSDLSYANGMNINLIDGTFNTASISTYSPVTITQLGLYFPQAKLGGGNYVYVWSGGWLQGSSVGSDGTNYFGIFALSALDDGWPADGLPSIPVRQAYAIDSKMDDGLPQSGRVLALEDGWGGIRWARGDGNNGAYPGTSAGGTSITCFDNGSAAGATMQYSMEVSNGSYPNCGLSFKMQ